MLAAQNFYFLRHGETQWNKDKIVQGQMDSQLNEKGKEQARRAAKILGGEPIKRIIASPLSRTKDTAKIVADHLKLPIEFDDGLMEVNLGDHEGKPYGDWIPGYWAGEYAPPNGETFQQFHARVWAALQRAINLGPDTLIVSHGGLWLAAQEYITMKPELRLTKNALPLKVSQTDESWTHVELKD